MPEQFLNRKEPNYALIRERCSYQPPAGPNTERNASHYEWKFEDRFGNRFGRFFYRLMAESSAPENAWVNVFQRSVHMSEFTEGHELAVATIFDDGCFAICLVRPPEEPKVIFRSSGKVELRGISPDDKHLLVEAAQEGDWLRPEVLVLDIAGSILSRLGQHCGVSGCWAGPWAPEPGDLRAIVHHEVTGFLEPAIWFPFENRLEEISTRLEGEVRAKWDRTGGALLLHRSLNGCSDLHRMDLRSRVVEQLQPLDGNVYRWEVDEENRAVGRWAANHMYVKRFSERERFPNEGFQPSVPLVPLKFRRIDGVPCFVAESSESDLTQWTIFDGYGDYFFHYSDTYWAKVQIQVDHGFRVVLVNTRGCNGFGRAWREARANDIGFAEIEDMRRVRSALVEEGLVDEERTIITGESWGGYMALLAMGTQPELWRMGIAGIPVGDWRTMHRETTPLTWAIRPHQFGGTPEASPEIYRRASPITYADKITSPVLVVTGEHDLLCPPEQNKRFAEAVRATGGQCELYLYEGAHGAPTREEFIRQQNKIVEFLFKNCRQLDNQ